MLKIPQTVVPAFMLGYIGTSLSEKNPPPSLGPFRKLGDSIIGFTARPEMQKYVFPILASGGVFAVTTRLWQVTTYPMAISTGNLLLGPIVGGAGLVAASVAASEAMHLMRGDQANSLYYRIRPSQSLNSSETWQRIFLPGALGIVFFTLLGGRWTHLVPSNLLAPGAFSERKLFRILSPRVLAANRREVQTTLGEISGCHSCGTRRGPFIADLTPPTEIVARQNFLKTQVYLPQCLPCGRRATDIARGLAKPGTFWEREILRHRELQLHLGAFRPHDITGMLIALVLLGGELQGRDDVYNSFR